ncbi:MAG: hypothetical protein FJZ64_00190 [Chlamydiae bacterium]|nr:hypothetical protein [Chlamydiota bacterium]
MSFVTPPCSPSKGGACASPLLLSPDASHQVDYVDANLKPDGNENKHVRGLTRKRAHTFVIQESAQKDPRRIRDENIAPDENGVFTVSSATQQGVERLWGFIRLDVGVVFSLWTPVESDILFV